MLSKQLNLKHLNFIANGATFLSNQLKHTAPFWLLSVEENIKSVMFICLDCYDSCLLCYLSMYYLHIPNQFRLEIYHSGLIITYQLPSWSMWVRNRHPSRYVGQLNLSLYLAKTTCCCLYVTYIKTIKHMNLCYYGNRVYIQDSNLTIRNALFIETFVLICFVCLSLAWFSENSAYFLSIKIMVLYEYYYIF